MLKPSTLYKLYKLSNILKMSKCTILKCRCKNIHPFIHISLNFVSGV